MARTYWPPGPPAAGAAAAQGLREFEISVPDVEEWYLRSWCRRIFVASQPGEVSGGAGAGGCLVITADTMVFLDDQRLGKPHDEAEALSMLTALSGRKHRVCTGVTVPAGGKALTRAQSTDVYFREASRPGAAGLHPGRRAHG